MTRQQAFVLQSANNDAWTYPNRFSKVVYLFTRESVLSHEFAEGGRRNQCVPSKLICLALILLHFRVNNLIRQVTGCIVEDERPLLFMKQHVPEFVKERKPHLIVGFVTKRQTDEGFLVGEPPCTTANSTMWQFRYQNHSNPCCCTNLL